jgi:DNA-binding response OmpR family regulator
MTTLWDWVAHVTTSAPSRSPELKTHPGGFCRDGLNYPLTGQKLKLLELFLDSPNRTVSSASIAENVIGDDLVSGGRLLGLVCELRTTLKKLLLLPRETEPIPNVDVCCWRLTLDD